jgi:hypothetical protein
MADRRSSPLSVIPGLTRDPASSSGLLQKAGPRIKSGVTTFIGIAHNG